MDIKAFKLLHEAEGTWWYRGRSRAVERAVGALHKGGSLNILDMGTGYGGMHDMLSKYGKVYGVELDGDAREVARKRGYMEVSDSLDVYEEKGMRFDLIAVLDVLEHVDDDSGLLKRLFGLLAPRGEIVLTVPASPRLWSDHDVSHHHRRRYTAESFVSVVGAAGGSVGYLGHWNVLLFPVALLMRSLGKSGESSFVPGGLVDRTLFLLVWIETSLIPWISYPFGISLISRLRARSAH